MEMKMEEDTESNKLTVFFTCSAGSETVICSIM